MPFFLKSSAKHKAAMISLATNFNIAPGEGMWDMMKGMNMENMQKMAGSLVPEGFIESLNAQLIKIKK